MTEIVVTKTASGALVPADPQAVDFLAKLKLGAAVKVKVARMRNYQFHKKVFALLNLAFDAWEPTEKTYKGEVIAKSFDQFRNDITVLAGYYETTVTLKGEVRLVARSLSFASMEQDEFEQLYSSLINVILQRILTQYTRDDLDNVIDQLMQFA